PLNLRNWLHFLRREEKAMSRLAQRAQVFPRIIVHDYGQVRAAFKILFNRLNRRRLSGKHNVEDVGPRAGPQADAVAWSDFGYADLQTLYASPIRLRIPWFHARPSVNPVFGSSCRADRAIAPALAIPFAV